ncbi:MAG: thiamine-phosphate kinase [Acidobacteriaceae bacterium]
MFATSRGALSLKLGIGDDCAVLQPPCGHSVLVTTDFCLEAIHFRRDWHTPESVGHRCLARGLSDLAAMGAQPLAAFLSLALPAELMQSRRGQPSWRERFFAGFLALAERYRVPLAGGDTARSPLLPSFSSRDQSSSGFALADIVLVGSAPRNRALLRSGAKAGDRIYVTGQLGGAAAELAQIAAHPRSFRSCKGSVPGSPTPHPHLFPEPRLAVGAWLLRNRRATATIDVSDGLSTDLDHICEESSVAAVVDAAALPLHPLAANSVADQALRLALDGGEDYELLFTASARMKVPRRIAGVPIACIGHLRQQLPRQPRMALVDGDGSARKERPLLAGGWEHY